MLLTPPLPQTVTPSRAPYPSSVTYFMDGPTEVLVCKLAERQIIKNIYSCTAINISKPFV